MHINPPQFLVNWIEDAKRADKLFYSFRFRPSFPEIFQSKDSQLKEKAARHYYYEGPGSQKRSDFTQQGKHRRLEQRVAKNDICL